MSKESFLSILLALFLILTWLAPEATGIKIAKLLSAVEQGLSDAKSQ